MSLDARPLARPVLIAVAPNGARRQRTDHPRLPLAPKEIAHEAAAAHEAGAAMLHLHVRDADGRHTLGAEAYRAAIAAVRDAVGARMIIQVTTEAVGRYRPEEQMALVRELRPEAVSLAVRELCPESAYETGFAALLAELHRERILAQHILYDRDDVVRLLDLVGRGVIPEDRLDVLLVLGRHGEERDPGPIELLDLLLATGDRPAGFMACAFGRKEAACGVAAALMGGDVRVGFENNLHLPDGRRASDNAALVTAVREPLAALGYPVATADDVRARAGRYPPVSPSSGACGG